MARLKKSNRIIDVNDEFLDSYLLRGYDQININGEIIKRATGGKNVSLGEFNKVLKEKDELVSKLEEVQKSPSEVADLKEEIKVLEAEVTRLDALVKQLKGQQGQHNGNKR